MAVGASIGVSVPTSVPVGQMVGTDYTAIVYGTPIQISQGTRGVFGRVIWASPIYRETVEVTIDPAHPDISTKKISTSYRDFAVSFGHNLAPLAEHGVPALLRLWADGDTIWDARFPDSRPPGILLGNIVPSGTSLLSNSNDFGISFYPGDESQEADPAIIAIEGDLANANRALMYVVLTRYQVGAVMQQGLDAEGTTSDAVFGQRETHELPNLMAEIVDGLVISKGTSDFTMIGGDVIRADGTFADYASNLIYGWSDISTSTPKLYRFNMSDELEVSSVTITSPVDSGFTLTSLDDLSEFSTFDRYNKLLLTSEGAGNTAPVITINPSTGIIVGFFGVHSTNTTPSDAALGSSLSSGDPIASVPSATCGDVAYVDGGIPVLVHGSFSEWVTPIPFDRGGPFLTEVNKAGTIADVVANGHIGSINFNDGGDLRTIAHMPLWEATGKPEQDGCCVIGVGNLLWAFYFGFRENSGLKIDILGRKLIHTFGGSDVVSNVLIDPKDKGIVVFVSNTGNWNMLKFPVVYGDPVSGGTTRYENDWQGTYPVINTTASFQRAIPPMNDGVDWTGLMNKSELTDQTLTYPSGLLLVTVDFGKGTYTSLTYTLPGDGMIWNSKRNRLYFTHGSGTNRVMSVVSISATSGETKLLSDYIRWIALKMGYDDSDITIDTGFDEVITGFLLDHTVDGTEIFNNLGTLYDFKYFESDGKIKFTRTLRGGDATDPVFDLTVDDLAKVEEDNLTDNDTMITILAAPVSQVGTVTVQYLDSEQNYTYQTQNYSLDRQVSGTSAADTAALFSPIISTAADMYDRISKVAIRQAATQDLQEFRLPQRYLRLEPTDVVGVTIAPFSYRIQLSEVTFNGDWSLSLLGVNYDFDDTIPTPDNENLGLHDDGHGLGPDMKNRHEVGYAVTVSLRAVSPFNEIGDWAEGFSMASSVQLERLFGASYSMGFAMASSLSTAISVSASMAEGFSMASVVTTVAVSKFSYSNTFGSGNRTGSITVSTTATTAGGGGSVSNLVNGNASVGSTNSWSWTNGQSSKEIKFDFGSGNTPVIKQARWKQDSSSTHGTWKWRGSNDDSSYTDIGSAFTLGGVNGTQIHTELIGNVAGYRYYKLAQQTGTTSSSPWLEEIEFFVDGSTDDNGDTSYYYALGGQTETNQNTPNVTGNTGAARSITCTVSSGPFAGTIDNLVDGNIGNNSTDSVEWTNGLTNMVLKFDFGSATHQRITAFFYVQSTSASQGTYTLAGSNDDSSYTTIMTGIDLSNSSSNHEQTFTNTDAWRYYRLTQTGGTTTGGGVPWVQEFYFKTCPRTW